MAGAPCLSGSWCVWLLLVASHGYLESVNSREVYMAMYAQSLLKVSHHKSKTITDHSLLWESLTFKSPWLLKVGPQIYICIIWPATKLGKWYGLAKARQPTLKSQGLSDKEVIVILLRCYWRVNAAMELLGRGSVLVDPSIQKFEFKLKLNQ